ncbi:hypothetical protein IT399_03810 [Candidatus Nomurabacteria bacterium]|nr:hypothetical protein [Candidatus Nomurabacteria bacterium]
MIFNKNKNNIKHKKDGRIDPHHFWNVFIIVFLTVLIFVIFGFTYFFIRTSNLLDKEVQPKVNANAGQIKKIEQSIEKTEKAISDRTGQSDTNIIVEEN